MSKLANALYRLSAWWADQRHKEPRVVIGPKGPELEWVSPQTTDSYGWDSKHYQRGNVHIEGMYNPVLVTANEVEDGEPEVDLLPSENYKAALLATEVIPKAMDPMDLDKLTMYVMATAGIAAFSLFAVLGLYM